jgi:phosphoribosylformylglycinamidine cyclo-ligase
VPRVLPSGVTAIFDTKAWDVPPIFRLVQIRGDIAQDEMYRVFNMGIGMVVIVAPEDAPRIQGQLPEATVIGKIVKQQGDDLVILD